MDTKAMKNDLKDMTVDELISFLTYNVKQGHVHKNAKVFIATDEEGNGFSPVVLRGAELDKTLIIFYPLKVSCDFPSSSSTDKE